MLKQHMDLLKDALGGDSVDKDHVRGLRDVAVSDRIAIRQAEWRSTNVSGELPDPLRGCAGGRGDSQNVGISSITPAVWTGEV
jgi:hypothetical protein